MKFSIGIGQKNYNHVGQLTNSTSCGFGEVQPVYSCLMLPINGIALKWEYTTYPSEITISPTIRSEKNIIVSSRKETVNPPKKFFLFRWFQRKQTVLQVDVVEKTPYIKTDNNRYIEVLK